jgi:hypothetical protein
MCGICGNIDPTTTPGITTTRIIGINSTGIKPVEVGSPSGTTVLFTSILVILWIGSMIALLWSASICGYSKAPGSIADSTTVYYERPRQQYYQTAAGFDPNMQRYQMNPAYGGNFVEIETTDTPSECTD